MYVVSHPHDINLRNMFKLLKYNNGAVLQTSILGVTSKTRFIIILNDMYTLHGNIKPRCEPLLVSQLDEQRPEIYFNEIYRTEVVI